jgi:hypothetical protein
MTYLQLFRFAFISVLIAGCVLMESLKEPSSKRALPQYWLSVSMFSGPFYDDDKLNLIDYRPFSSIEYVELLDGKVLYPPKANNVIKAGTLVRIQAISYPSEKKPLYSPRDNIWVYLQVARERGNVSMFYEKSYVLIIPKTITSEPQLRGYLSRFLSHNDPNRWILQLESYLQDAIFQKIPVIGMKREHMVAALGPALKKQFHKARDFDNAQEVWHYHDYLVVITNDEVTKVTKLMSDQSSNAS